jgi:hypothetical protein
VDKTSWYWLAMNRKRQKLFSKQWNLFVIEEKEGMD